MRDWLTSDFTSGRAAMPQKMPNLARILPGDMTYYLLPFFHTYSVAVVIVSVFDGKRKYLPRNWRPHRLVDMMSTNDIGVKVHCFLAIDGNAGHSSCARGSQGGVH